MSTPRADHKGVHRGVGVISVDFGLYLRFSKLFQPVYWLHVRTYIYVYISRSTKSEERGFHESRSEHG